MKLQWRKRNNPNAPNYGQAFPVEPHGHKTDLPKGVRQVSLSEIPEYIKRRREKNMTDEEKEVSDLIEQAIQEDMDNEITEEKKRNLVQKLADALEKNEKREKLKKVLEEAKEEAKENEGTDDGYEEYQENLERIKKQNDSNEVFG